MPATPAFPVRSEWDLDPDFITVNHGSFGATPRVVLRAQRAWQERMERQPTRFMTVDYPAAIRAAATALGNFLGAPGEEIAFVDNATTGCNAVLRGLSLAAGDEIVLLSHAYGAVRNTVRFVAERAGARIVEAAMPYPDPTHDSLLTAVTAVLGPRTRLAVIDHVTSGSAVVLPVQAIVAACHAAGVPVLIDGAHGPGQVDVDLTAIGADWYVGNCHKWLCAPKGCAFIHARADAQTGLHPAVISHGYNKGFTEEFDWTGTTDPSRFLAIGAALAFHERLGGAAMRARNHQLALDGVATLARRLNTSIGASGECVGAMATIRLPVDDASPENALRIRSRLLTAGTDAPVNVLDGAAWLRISAFAYNAPEDYARLADVVGSVLRG